jgi:hypothetical protein
MKNKLLFLHLAFSVYIVASGTGCRNVDAQSESLLEMQKMLSEVFLDFDLVTCGEYDPAIPQQHGMNRIPFPENIVLGRKYIFHRRNPTDNSELFRDLQRRLQEKDASVMSASESFDRYIGGLAFQIVFRRGKHVGIIINSLDDDIVKNESLAKEWSLDDYVLVVHEDKTH